MYIIYTCADVDVKCDLKVFIQEDPPAGRILYKGITILYVLK